MRQKGFFILPVLLVIITVSVLGYFVYQNRQAQRASNIFTPSPATSISTPPNTPSTYPKLSTDFQWKNYTNKIMGYFLKYPEFLDEHSYSDVPITAFIKADEHFFLQAESKYNYTTSFETIYNLASDQSIPEKIISGVKTTKITNKTIGGYKVAIYTEVPLNPSELSYKYELVALICDGNKTIELSMFGDSKQQVDRFNNIFTEILNSFKFLN